MNQMTIKLKLMILVGVMCAITTGVGAISYFSAKQVDNSYLEIIHVNMPNLRIVQDMFLEFRRVRTRIRTLGLSGLNSSQGAQAITAANEAIVSYEKLDKEYLAIEFLPGEEEVYRPAANDWLKLKAISEKAIALYRSQTDKDRQELLRLFLEDEDSIGTSFTAHIRKLVDFHKDMAERRSKEAEAITLKATQIEFAMIFGGLSLSLILAFFIVRQINMNLVNIAGQVGKSSDQVTTASSNLAAASQQLASSTQEQASSVEEVSASLEEITAMVGSTVTTSEDAVNLSKNIAQLVSSGSESMKQLQASVAEIAESNERIEKLSKLIEEVGEKTQLIDEIVFQTKLLSFNASVEAERAGEHGRGFAVVAQEVGNLAEMSGKSATEITKIIKTSIVEAKEVSQLSRIKVNQGAEICKETASKLVAIQKASEDILAGSQKILRASEEQSAGIGQINQSIQLISQSIQQNASGAEECSGSSAALQDQGLHLKEAVTALQLLVQGRVSSQVSQVSQPSTVLNFKPAVTLQKQQPKPLAKTGTDAWEKI